MAGSREKVSLASQEIGDFYTSQQARGWREAASYVIAESSYLLLLRNKLEGGGRW